MTAKKRHRLEGVEEYLTTGQAASVLGVSDWTIRQLDETGRLPAHHRTIGEHRRYKLSEIQKLLEELKK